MCASAPASQTDIQANRFFQVEIRIADLEGQIAGMRSEIEQLLERRRALCAGHVGDQRRFAPKVGMEPDRS